jgi:hypothetical protein
VPLHKSNVACKLKMTLPAIYIILYLLTVILCFIKLKLKLKYKKVLIGAHVILLLILIIDIFVVNLKGVWLERLIVVAFLLTASTTFALYGKTLGLWQKVYFGFFLFYPAIAATTLLMDRLFFAIVASPLLVSLTVPETIFSDKYYEVREQFGIIAPKRLQLFKKGFITEKLLGSCNDENVVFIDITSLKIKSETEDTTKVIIMTKDKVFAATFTKITYWQYPHE